MLGSRGGMIDAVMMTIEEGNDNDGHGGDD